jgi:threonine synthase
MNWYGGRAMYETHLRCVRCGKTYELTRLFEGCSHCKEEKSVSNLIVSYDYEKIKEAIKKNHWEKKKDGGIWKYSELLPGKNEKNKVTLGEGGTPLLPCKRMGKELDLDSFYVKDESRNPTHTFKDRIISVGTAVAVEFGSHYVMAGGGNTAAAASAYSARHGLEVISFETPFESQQAVMQTRSYGGNVVYLARYEDRYALMKRCVDTLHGHPVSSYTPSPTGDPYSYEGYKTIAYELCEQHEVPEFVIVPTGQGNGLHGIWRGFVDLFELGMIDSLPRMVAAESTAAGTLTRALHSKKKRIEEVVPRETVARQTRIPQVSYQGYRAVVDSDGTAVMVDDTETMNTLMTLARKEGIFSSTTSAVALAAAKKLREEGDIDKTSTVVCVITGGGLKDPDYIMDPLAIPQTPIEGTWKTFTAFMKMQYGLLLDPKKD